MSLTVTLLAMTLVISFGALLLNLISAPEGYEDETGFRPVARGQRDSGRTDVGPGMSKVSARAAAV